jgi:hypothetical protein
VVVPEKEDEVVVPETQESVQVVVFETQPEADVYTQPHAIAEAGHKFGGFHQPNESDGDAYLSYSQFLSHSSEQGYS